MMACPANDQSAPGTLFGEPFSKFALKQLAHHFLVAKQLPNWRAPTPTREHVKRADNIIARIFTYIGETFCLPAHTDWSYNPSADKEWLIAHHKHYFSIDLCQAWSLTGDQSYLDAWVSLTTTFIDQIGLGTIKSSDAQVEAKRVESWVTSYLVLRQSGRHLNLPPDFVCKLVERLGLEANYIAANLRPSRNHRTFQLFAMFLVGLLFPELKDGPALRDRAHGLLVQNLMTDFDAGGVHVERSTHYHNITLETALGFLELAIAAGLDIAQALRKRLRLAARFAAYSLLPDGEIPLIGDSDNLDHRALFEAAYRLFGDPQLLWAATRGESGIPLYPPSYSFSGYFTLSDGSTDFSQPFSKRQHIFYDCAPLGEGSHSHYDLFSLCWSAGGRQVIVDPGRFTYHAEPDQNGNDWRYAFKRTSNHNTVEVDGLDQTRYLSKSPRPPAGIERYDSTKHKAKHGPPPDILDPAQHLGALGDWVMATASSKEYRPRHTRGLVFMRRQYVVLIDHILIDDDAVHSCSASLHLAADWSERVLLKQKVGLAVARSDGWTIAIAPRGDGKTRCDVGWVSKTYGIKDTAPVLTTSMSSSRSLDLCTVLMPDTGSQARLNFRGVTWLPQSDGEHAGIAVDLNVNDQAYRDLFVMMPLDRGSFSFGDIEYRGKLMAARTKGGHTLEVFGRGPAFLTVGATHLSTQEAHFEQQFT